MRRGYLIYIVLVGIAVLVTYVFFLGSVSHIDPYERLTVAREKIFMSRGWEFEEKNKLYICHAPDKWIR